MSNIRKSQTGKTPVGKTSKSVQNSVSTTTSVNPIKTRPPKTTSGSGKTGK